MYKLFEDDGSYHLGHFIRTYMSDEPDRICQIDAGTGEQETKRSVLSRSIRLSQSFRKYRLKPGDVVALGGKNHLDCHIPLYSAMMNGLPLAGVDPLYQYDEIKSLFTITSPKVAFCEPESYKIYTGVAKELDLKTLVITFRGGPYTMQQFMEEYHDSTPEDQFEIAQFDVHKIYCWLVSTSGSTGTPKVAAMRQTEVMKGLEFFDLSPPKGEPRTALHLSSMQWLSSTLLALVIPVNHIKVQTSANATPKHVAEMINKYKPKTLNTTPTLLARLLVEDCDFTCFDVIVAGGSKVHKEAFEHLRNRMRKDAKLLQGYGQTESIGGVMKSADDSPFGSCGKLMSRFEAKLVDPDSGKVITEPYVNGELWVRGPRIVEYYNNPKATEEAFTKDGFFKTGDILYRDENDNYFFVDRLKMLIKWRNYQIIPPEIEDVIFTHPGVDDVCVTSLENAEDGERVVACVVRKSGYDVTAQEIKDLVASKLSVHKHLHGGVVFMDKIPLTSTDKVARAKIRELVKTARIE